jgi:hypothetical protein
VSLILSIDGRLVRVGGSLLSTSGGVDCCCNPTDEAVLFVECCDGEPRLWIIATRADGCGTVKVGQFCYRNTGQRETVAAVEASGGVVLRAFNEAAGDGCVTDCFDDRCRPCPRECCIRVFLPRCEVTALGPLGEARCCGLGSAYRLDYTERRTRLVTGYDCTGGGCLTAPNGVGCIGFNPGVIIDEEALIRASVTWGGRGTDGDNCSGVMDTANRTFTTRTRAWRSGGYVLSGGAVVPLIGIYEDEPGFRQDDIPHFQPGELPQVDYIATDRRFTYPDGVEMGIFDACNTTSEVNLCERIGSPDDPCPSPTNPVTVRVIDSVVGSWDCTGGNQTHTTRTTTTTCALANQQAGLPALVQETVVTVYREWSLTVLSREGCEVDPCIDPAPSPGPGTVIRPPPPAGGGCSGCRQGPGL